MKYNGEHDDYFLVVFDDYQGNIDTEGKIEGGIVRYLNDNGFTCSGGFWRMPWFWIDIRHKFFFPGRPGIAYGKAVGNHVITFEEFKTIYEIYKKYEGLRILQMDNTIVK